MTSSRRVAATRVAGSGARAGARNARRILLLRVEGFPRLEPRGDEPRTPAAGRRPRGLRPVDDRMGCRSNRREEDVVGVLLLNLGGPETLDVQPFLYNLFYDPDILDSRLQFLQSPLAALLSNSRAPKSREAYESIGGGSPLRRITDEQQTRCSLRRRKGLKNAKCYVGMRYWKPFTEEAVEQIKADGVTKPLSCPFIPSSPSAPRDRRFAFYRSSARTSTATRCRTR